MDCICSSSSLDDPALSCCFWINQRIDCCHFAHPTIIVLLDCRRDSNPPGDNRAELSKKISTVWDDGCREHSYFLMKRCISISFAAAAVPNTKLTAVPSKISEVYNGDDSV